MAIRGEDDTSSKLQDFKIGSSWIPETPTKPGPTNQQPICTNWQQDSLAKPNWLEAERCTPASQAAQVNVCEPESITENFLQEFDNWQAGEAASSRVYGENSCTYDQFPINAAEQWTNMPFGKLLALAEANGNKTAIENTLTHHFATSGSSDSYFHQQTEGGQFTVSFEDSSQKDQGSLLRANFNAESKISNFETNGSSVPDRHFFDLNSLPRTNAGSALRKSTSSQFEPEDNMDRGTPETTNMNAPRRSQRSCRISLNFDSDGLERDGSSTYCPSSNWDRESQAENFNAKDKPSAAPDKA